MLKWKKNAMECCNERTIPIGRTKFKNGIENALKTGWSPHYAGVVRKKEPVMSEPLITIPLSRYVLLECKHREFGYIDEVFAGTIKSIPGNERVCVVERESFTATFTGEVLGEPAPGLYRLWPRSNWDVAQNAQRSRAAQRQFAEIYIATLRIRVAEIMSKQLNGLLPASAFVNSLKNTKREDLEKVLTTAGEALPVIG